jgi:hypothetical protein
LNREPWIPTSGGCGKSWAKRQNTWIPFAAWVIDFLEEAASHLRVVLGGTGGPSADPVEQNALLGAIWLEELAALVGRQAERFAQQLRAKSITGVIAQEFLSGLWVKDDRSFVNVAQVQPDSVLLGIRIYEFDNEHRLRKISPNGIITTIAGGGLTAPATGVLATAADVAPRGIARDRLRLSYKQSLFIRRRFTVLDLAHRTGVLESSLQKLFGSGGAWAANSSR